MYSKFIHSSIVNDEELFIQLITTENTDFNLLAK